LSWIDAVMAALMFLGFVHGLLKGSIQEVFAVLALVVGVLVAGRVAEGTEAITSQLSHPTAAKVFVFILTFFVVALIIGLIGKMFSGLAKTANLRTIDRLLGGIVGACLVGLAIGVVLQVGAMFGMSTEWVQGSPLARQLMLAVSYLARFLPEARESIGV
jgi:membrane protein required for colicin V production